MIFFFRYNYFSKYHISIFEYSVLMPSIPGFAIHFYSISYPVSRTPLPRRFSVYLSSLYRSSLYPGPVGLLEVYITSHYNNKDIYCYINKNFCAISYYFKEQLFGLKKSIRFIMLIFAVFSTDIK